MHIVLASIIAAKIPILLKMLPILARTFFNDAYNSSFVYIIPEDKHLFLILKNEYDLLLDI